MRTQSGTHCPHALPPPSPLPVAPRVPAHFLPQLRPRCSRSAPRCSFLATGWGGRCQFDSARWRRPAHPAPPISLPATLTPMRPRMKSPRCSPSGSRAGWAGSRCGLCVRGPSFHCLARSPARLFPLFLVAFFFFFLERSPAPGVWNRPDKLLSCRGWGRGAARRGRGKAGARQGGGPGPERGAPPLQPEEGLMGSRSPTAPRPPRPQLRPAAAEGVRCLGLPHKRHIPFH